MNNISIKDKNVCLLIQCLKNQQVKLIICSQIQISSLKIILVITQLNWFRR